LAGQTEGLISGLMKYLVTSEVRGRKFKQPNPESMAVNREP
jgi:hypothetical protein